MEEKNILNDVNPRLESITGGLAYSVATGFFIGVSLMAGLLVAALQLSPETEGFIYINYLAAPVAIASGIAVTLWWRKVKFREVFPVKCKPKYYLIAALIIFGLLFSLGWVNDVTVEFFKLFGYQPRPAESYMPDMTGGKVVLAFIVMAILPPLFEETLFRGVILNGAERGMGSVRAIFVTGFCFSLFHASPEQTVYQFIAGCAFAFVAVRSRSILPSVLMHVINNGIIVIMYACGAFDASGALIISDGGNVALTVISALSLIGGIVWLVIDTVIHKNELIKCKKGGVANFFLYALVGIIILAIMWVVSFFPVV